MKNHNTRSEILQDIFTHQSARTEIATEEIFLKIKCPHCSTSNLVPVNKIAHPQKTLETTINKPINLYEPKKIVKCKKCGSTIAEPTNLIKIKNQDE